MGCDIFASLLRIIINVMWKIYWKRQCHLWNSDTATVDYKCKDDHDYLFIGAENNVMLITRRLIIDQHHPTVFNLLDTVMTQEC